MKKKSEGGICETSIVIGMHKIAKYQIKISNEMNNETEQWKISAVKVQKKKKKRQKLSTLKRNESQSRGQ